MSVVTRDQLSGQFSQQQVDDIVNALLVPAHEFAQRSSLFHRWYGTITGAADGEREYSTDPNIYHRSETKDRFVINPCLRFQYAQVAAKVQESVENELGWLTTTRYVSEDIEYSSYANWKLQTRWLGVEKMNVVQVWHNLAEYDQIPVPIFMEEATVVLNAYSDNTPAVQIDNSLFPNPNDVWIRDNSYVAYPWFNDGKHRIERGVDYWQLALDTTRQGYTDPTTLSVQSKRFVQVRIMPPTLPDGAELHPVYPGTNQIIPQAKPMYVEDSRWVYTFWIYTLVHPDFETETVDLTSAAEFWKLYPYIAFKYTTEEIAYPQVIVTRGSDVVIFSGPEATENTEVGPTATLVSTEKGYFHLNYDCCQSSYAWRCLCQDWPQTVKLRVFYKVNPEYLPAHYAAFRNSIYDAVCGRIAAELPTENCNCKIDWGYIQQKQTVANGERVVTPNGAVIDRVRYLNLVGQVECANILNQAPKYKRVGIVPA